MTSIIKTGAALLLLAATFVAGAGLALSVAAVGYGIFTGNESQIPDMMRPFFGVSVMAFPFAILGGCSFAWLDD